MDSSIYEITNFATLDLPSVVSSPNSSSHSATEKNESLEKGSNEENLANNIEATTIVGQQNQNNKSAKQQRVLGLIEVRRKQSQDQETQNTLPVQFYNENQIRSASIVLQVADVLQMNELLKERGYKTIEPEPPMPTPEGKFYTEMSFLDSDGHLIVLYHLT